jgi:hypothetical protein
VAFVRALLDVGDGLIQSIYFNLDTRCVFLSFSPRGKSADDEGKV